MIYLNNAATSWPKPEEVYLSVDKAMRTHGAGFGRGGGSRSVENAEIVHECRCLIAELFGIPHPDRVIFTLNATDSINIAFKGFLKKWDHVVISDMEHNAVCRPLKKMEWKKLIEVSIVKSGPYGTLDPSDVKEAIRQDTALVEVIHMSNITGAANDITAIGKLCSEFGIPFMVDASQSAGVVDIDVVRDNISILALSGHKGLFGPQGTGILYIAPDMTLDTLREGGTGSFSKSFSQPTDLPDRFESGTMNFPGIAGLLEGVKFISRVGIGPIYAHETELVRQLKDAIPDIDGLTPYISGKTPSNILSFSINGVDSSHACDFLSSRDIAVRGGFHCSYLAHRKLGTVKNGLIRISPGFFNTADDIKMVIDNIHACVKEFR